jgi:hypothetical protein
VIWHWPSLLILNAGLDGGSAMMERFQELFHRGNLLGFKTTSEVGCVTR